MHMHERFMHMNESLIHIHKPHPYSLVSFIFISLIHIHEPLMHMHVFTCICMDLIHIHQFVNV